MTIDSTDNDKGNSFEYRLKEVSNEEIITILRYREHYQPHALKEAIKEAIRRGIITSIDELEKEEFKPQPIPPKSLFPINISESQNYAIFKSLCKITYGFGIIPLLNGILQLVDYKITIGMLSLLMGLAVLFLTYKLEKQRKIIYSQALLYMNLPSIGYAIYYLVSLGKPNTMDIFAILIIILVFLYSTYYLHKLNNNINKKAIL